MIYSSSLSLNLSALKTSMVMAGFKVSKILSTWWGKIFTTIFILLISAAIISPAIIVNLIPALFSGGGSAALKEIFSVMFIFVVTDRGAELFNIWLGGLLGIVLGAPIISNTLNSSYSKSLLLGVRRNITYQISDSIVLQFISPLVIISLLYTLVISFLYRYSYEATPALTFLMLCSWLVSVFLLTFMGWFNEYMTRRTSSYYKIFYGLFVATVFYFVFAFNGGNDFFGLSGFLADNVPILLTNFYLIGLIFISLVALGLASLWGTFIVGSKAIHQYPEVFKDKKYSTKWESSLTLMSLKILFRYETIKAPLIFMLLVLTPVFVLQAFSTTVAIYSLSFVLPLIFNLTIFINIFGLINSGNAWVASLPKFRAGILKQAFLLNLSLIMGAATIVSSLGLLTGNISFPVWVKFILLNLTSATICFIISLNNSLNKATRYDFHLRGENIAPAGSSLKLTGQMITFGGIPLLAVAPVVPSWMILLLFLILIVIVLLIIKHKTTLLYGTKMNEVISKMGQ
jgi:hypothetical protein